MIEDDDPKLSVFTDRIPPPHDAGTYWEIVMTKIVFIMAAVLASSASADFGPIKSFRDDFTGTVIHLTSTVDRFGNTFTIGCHPPDSDDDGGWVMWRIEQQKFLSWVGDDVLVYFKLGDIEPYRILGFKTTLQNDVIDFVTEIPKTNRSGTVGLMLWKSLTDGISRNRFAVRIFDHVGRPHTYRFTTNGLNPDDLYRSCSLKFGDPLK